MPGAWTKVPAAWTKVPGAWTHYTGVLLCQALWGHRSIELECRPGPATAREPWHCVIEAKGQQRHRPPPPPPGRRHLMLAGALKREPRVTSARARC